METIAGARWRGLDGAGEGDGEGVFGVAPGAGGLEAGGGEEAFEGVGAEFVTVFGMNGFAGDEVEGEGGAGGVGGDADLLAAERDKMHFDAGVGGVP